MTKYEVLENADARSMKEAFSAWYKFDVNEDMDIQTEIAWRNWQIAWNAALAQLYTVLPQRKPLTEEQAKSIVGQESWGADATCLNAQLLRTVRRVEAAHEIKD